MNESDHIDKLDYNMCWVASRSRRCVRWICEIFVRGPAGLRTKKVQTPNLLSALIWVVHHVVHTHSESSFGIRKRDYTWLLNAAQVRSRQPKSNKPSSRLNSILTHVSNNLKQLGHSRHSMIYQYCNCNMSTATTLLSVVRRFDCSDAGAITSQQDD